MKVSRIAVLFTIAIFATSTSAISVSAAGRTSASIPNTILNGKGLPLSSLGINGDFYIDTRSLLIFGPKAKGKWPLPRNLQGPIGATGVTGSDGKNGSDAKIGVNNSSLLGSVGPQGERGLTGAAGPAGPAGSSGSGGGTPGATGAAGATGASGAAGSIGPTGPAGSTGATGLTGANGERGVQGELGSAGAAGTSEVTVVSIPSFTINTNIARGSATSAAFGTLATNSSYFFQIFITGEAAASYFDFAASINSTGETPIYNYAASRSKLVTLPGKSTVYGVTVTGTIKTAAAASTLSINVIDVTGESSLNSGVVFSGRVYLQKVGTIN